MVLLIPVAIIVISYELSDISLTLYKHELPWDVSSVKKHQMVED